MFIKILQYYPNLIEVCISLLLTLLYLVKMFFSLLSTAFCGNLPTYKYFVIKDGFEEIEIHDPVVQGAYEYAADLCTKFVPDFTKVNAITLIHAYHKEEGNYYAVELLTNRIQYLVTVQFEDDKYFLYSVRILNREGPGGARWSEPDEIINDLCMSRARDEFGQDLKLNNVALWTTQMAGTTYGHWTADIISESERMLVDVRLEKPFGEPDYNIVKIERIY